MAVQKGKKGTKGQQQIYDENKESLKFYLGMCLASHVCLLLEFVGYNVLPKFANILADVGRFVAYAAILLFGFPGSYGSKVAWVMEFVSLALQLLALLFMRMIARPSFSNGQLIDGGIDLAMENGMGEHSKDIIIWTTVTQMLSIIHRYFWFLLFLIPVRLLYGVWSSFLSPWFFSRSGSGGDAAGDDSDEARRKAEKKQRKAERPKFVVHK